MTLEQATTVRNTLNASLLESGANEKVKYDVFAYWNNLGEKLYNVVMFPKTHEAKFELGNDSQRLAFYRVYLRSIGSPMSYDAFTVAFETQKSLDTELNNYLKP